MITGLFETAPPSGKSTFITPERLFTQADIEVFAALSGDHHPQHLDAGWAQQSRFGGLLAHGMLVLSGVIPLLPAAPENVVALRGVECTFKRPVRPGDRIHANVEVSEPTMLNATDGLVDVRIRGINQDDTTVLLAKIRILCTWPGEPDQGEVVDAHWSDVLGESVAGVVPL